MDVPLGWEDEDEDEDVDVDVDVYADAEAPGSPEKRAIVLFMHLRIHQS